MKYLMIGLIKLYRKFISPIKPKCCRFTPTCSEYALEAFRKRGFFAGFILTVWRILRCNPFSKGGFDPVPEKGFRRVRTESGELSSANEFTEGQADADICPEETTEIDRTDILTGATDVRNTNEEKEN